MLTKDYDQLMRASLRAFAENMSQNGTLDKKYTLFYPTVGKDFGINRELIVYGQAVNGWDGDNEWTVNQVAAEADKIFENSAAYSQGENGKCPLEWVNEGWAEYKLFRSFFWNVTYKLVKAKYGRTDENWNNIIAWSNVMKIAPANHANPDLLEIEAQLDHSAKLFTKELDDLRPKHVLLITNLQTWAAPLLERAGITYGTVGDSPHVQATAVYNDTLIIVTKRPYVAAHQPFIDAVMSCME